MLRTTKRLRRHLYDISSYQMVNTLAIMKRAVIRQRILTALINGQDIMTTWTAVTSMYHHQHPADCQPVYAVIFKIAADL